MTEQLLINGSGDDGFGDPGKGSFSDFTWFGEACRHKVT